jgi:hypothetical protein
LYFNFFSASFCTTFLSAGIATSISVHVLLLLLLLLLLLRLLLSWVCYFSQWWFWAVIRTLYVKFQIILSHFQLSVHCSSVVIFRTLSSDSSLSLREGPIRLLLHVFFMFLSFSTIQNPRILSHCCCSTSPITNSPVFITFLGRFSQKLRKNDH